MAVNGKKKGSRNERMICKMLTEWSGLDFRRSPQSGGLRGHVTDYTVGDIVCTDRTMLNKVFPYSIECKSYAQIDFSKLIQIPARANRKNSTEFMKCEIDEFWAQCLSDAERGQKLPLLIMRYNALPKDFFFMVLGKNFVTKSIIPSNRIITE